MQLLMDAALDPNNKVLMQAYRLVLGYCATGRSLQVSSIPLLPSAGLLVGLQVEHVLDVSGTSSSC
jgi:hypothetical protein